MKLTLAYPPTVNTYWRVVNGRPILSAEARAYKQGTKLRALTQGARIPLAGPVALNLAVYRPRRVGDLDNVLKAILDALKGIAFEDDKQVVQIFATRWDDAARPRVEVNVEAWLSRVVPADFERLAVIAEQTKQISESTERLRKSLGMEESHG